MIKGSEPPGHRRIHPQKHSQVLIYITIVTTPSSLGCVVLEEGYNQESKVVVKPVSNGFQGICILALHWDRILNSGEEVLIYIFVICKFCKFVWVEWNLVLQKKVTEHFYLKMVMYGNLLLKKLVQRTDFMYFMTSQRRKPYFPVSPSSSLNPPSSFF